MATRSSRVESKVVVEGTSSVTLKLKVRCRLTKGYSCVLMIYSEMKRINKARKGQRGREGGGGSVADNRVGVLIPLI